MSFGYVVARHRTQSIAERAKTDYLSGMPPKKKELTWADVLDHGLVFDAEDANEIVRRFQEKLPGFVFSVKLVQREPAHALALLNPKTKRIVYGEKGWRDYAKDRVTPPGCNEETGQLF
jgi:hypothetical protein